MEAMMRRGRYGNRVSFRVSMDLSEGYSVEDLRRWIERVLKSAGDRDRVNKDMINVRWPADYHGGSRGTQIGGE